MAARTILVGGPDVSHGSLTGRDSANGHPTSAITGLDTALAERVAVGWSWEEADRVRVEYPEKWAAILADLGIDTKAEAAVKG